MAATPGLELLEIGIGMEEFRKRSVTTSGLVWLELGLVWTEFGKVRQQHRGWSCWKSGLVWKILLCWPGLYCWHPFGPIILIPSVVHIIHLHCVLGRVTAWSLMGAPPTRPRLLGVPPSTKIPIPSIIFYMIVYFIFFIYSNYF